MRVDRTPVIETQLAPIPEGLLRKCPGPKPIPPPEPAGCNTEDPACGLPASVTFPLLLDNTENLRICSARQWALVDAVRERDAIQGGAK